MKFYISEDKKIRLYNGDCIKIMDGLISKGVKLKGVMTSPPYNIIRPNCSDRGYDEYKDGMTNEEYCKWTCDIFNRFDKILDKDTCVIYNMSYGGENTECMNLAVAHILMNTNYTLADIVVWKKSSAVPNSMSKNRRTRIVEFVYIFCRKDELKTFNTNKQIKSYRKTGQPNYENVFNFVEAKNNDGACSLNKATYSSELCEKLMSFYYKEGDTILDCFNGTGTTGVACKNLNMNYVGIELSEQQFEYSKERLSEGGNIND